MRKLDTSILKKVIKEEISKIAFSYPKSIYDAIKDNLAKTDDKEANILKLFLDNEYIAKSEHIALCQDTGMVIVDLEIGNEVFFVGDFIEEVINEAISEAYVENYLRYSVVDDPLFERNNTNNNTPAVIHYSYKPGDKVKVRIGIKGFGSENCSRIKMLKPSEGLDGVKEFILETVKLAGPNPCPPIVVGVGIGGTFDYASYLAKKSLFREINVRNSNSNYCKLEENLIEEINKLNIGAAGLHGKLTCLGVNIEYYPTHIAGLPVAVNISCHATRHSEVIL